MGHLQKSHQPNTYNTWSLEKEALKNASSPPFSLACWAPKVRGLHVFHHVLQHAAFNWQNGAPARGQDGQDGWQHGHGKHKHMGPHVQLLKFALSVLRLYYLYSMDKFSDAFRLSGINVTIFRLHVHSLLDLWFADWLHRPAAASETETTEATWMNHEATWPHVLARKSLGSWSEIRTFPEKKPSFGPVSSSRDSNWSKDSFLLLCEDHLRVHQGWLMLTLMVAAVNSLLGPQKSQRCRPPEPNSNEVGRVYARWVFGWRRMLTYSHDFTCIHSTSIIDLWFQKTITNLSFLLRLRCYIPRNHGPQMAAAEL